MNLYEIKNAISDANRTLQNADHTAGQLANILSGRLRQVPNYILKDLKKELKDFNAHTGEWKKL